MSKVEVVVATWNVLHRIYAEKWGQYEVLAAYPSEKEPQRLSDIATITERMIAQHGDHVAILFQEVVVVVVVVVT